MEYLNMWEKLRLLFNLICSNYLFIILLVLSMVILIINKLKIISNKKTGLLIVLSFIISFSVILFYNSDTLFKTFDNISNLIFKNIYFPSIYVYVGIILISDIIILMSVLSKNISKLYKNINLVAGFFMNFLLLILLNTIGSDSIDVLAVNSLYTNNYVVSLIELSTGLFILWLMILLLISIINNILLVIEDKNMVTEPTKLIDPRINMVELEVKDTNINKEYKKTDSEVEAYPLNSLNKDNLATAVDVSDKIVEPVMEVNQEVEVNNNRLVFNDFVKRDNVLLDELKQQNNDVNVLMNLKPIMPSNEVKENVVEDFDIKEQIMEPFSFIKKDVVRDNKNNTDKYTKEDYKLFYTILNTVKENNRGKTNLTMDDALSVSLLNKYSIKEYNLYKKMLEDVM